MVFLSNSTAGENDEDVSFIFDELTSDANRKKIAMTTSDGETQCYVEIEKWDDTNEQAWLWFKAPSVSNTSNTDFYLYYDSDHADNTAYVDDTNVGNSHNVWDNSFKMIQHMRDSRFEDFTTYDENDANDRYSITSSRVTITGLQRGDDNHYVADSKGVGHFGDFEHLIDVYLDDTYDPLARDLGMVWGSANSENDLKYFADNEIDALFVGVYGSTTDLKFYLKLWAIDGATVDVDYSIPLDEDTIYYLKIERSGTTLTCKIYSDASRTTLVDTLSVTCPNTTFEYVYGSCSYGGTKTYDITGYVENLDLQEGFVTSATVDSTSNNNDGTKKAAGEPAVTTSGKIDDAQDFDGTDDYIDCGDINDIDGATQLTVSAWVYHDTITDDDYIASKFQSDKGFLLFRDDVGFSSGRTDIYDIFVRDEATHGAKIEGSQGSSPLQSWTFVVFTFIGGSATGLRLYVNGVEDAQSPVTTSVVEQCGSGTTSLKIGERVDTGTLEFNGKIDEVRISTTVRNSAWVKASYETGRDHLLDYGSEETEEDTTAPTYSDVGTNTTIAGNPCLFYAKWTDETNLTTGGYIFGTNNTGTWSNDTWTQFPTGGTSDWSNVTKTLNSTIGVRVEWTIWANDTANNWNNTGTQYLITTSAQYNFYGSINGQLTIGAELSWTFDRFGTINSQFTIDSQKLPSFDISSALNLVFTIASQRTWSFDRFGAVNPLFTVDSQKAVSFSLFPSITQTFSVAGTAEFISEQILNFFGSISQSITVTVQKMWSFNVFSLMNPQFTVSSRRFWAFSRYGTVNQQYLVDSQRAFSFTRFSSINPTFQITSTTDFIANILNFFGSIGQTFSVATERTWSFSRFSALNPILSISGNADFVFPLLEFFGSINAVIEPTGWTDLPIPAIEAPSRLWMIGFMFGGVGFILAALALLMRGGEEE